MRQNPSETLRSKGEQCEWKRGVGRGGEREQGQNTGEGKVVRQGGGGLGEGRLERTCQRTSIPDHRSVC